MNLRDAALIASLIISLVSVGMNYWYSRKRQRKDELDELREKLESMEEKHAATSKENASLKEDNYRLMMEKLRQIGNQTIGGQ